MSDGTEVRCEGYGWCHGRRLVPRATASPKPSPLTSVKSRASQFRVSLNSDIRVSQNSDLRVSLNSDISPLKSDALVQARRMTCAPYLRRYSHSEYTVSATAPTMLATPTKPLKKAKARQALWSSHP